MSDDPIVDGGTLKDQPVLDLGGVERPKLEKASTLFDLHAELGTQPEIWEGRAGALLEAVDAGTGEPEYQAVRGQVWQLSGRHVFVVGDVINGWERWVPYLTHGALFLPYPEPFVTLTDKAQFTKLVMVQPDEFLAGHLLTKHATAFGADTLELLVSHVWK